MTWYGLWGSWSTLLRYERRLEPLGGLLVADAKALAAQPLQGQRLLLAIGGRHLSAMAAAVRRAGAIPYGRALPLRTEYAQPCGRGCPWITRRGASPAGEVPGAIERALCRRWGIGGCLPPVWW